MKLLAWMSIRKPASLLGLGLGLGLAHLLALGAVLLPACGSEQQLLAELRAQLTPGQRTKVVKPKAKPKVKARDANAKAAVETAKLPAEKAKPAADAAPAKVPKKATVAVFTSSHDEAFAEAKKTDRKVLLVLTGEHCNPCHDMRDHVFPLAEVRKAFGPYVVLADKTGITFAPELDADVDAGELWSVICDPDGSASVPTLAVFDTDGRLLKKTVGWADAAEVIAFLK